PGIAIASAVSVSRLITGPSTVVVTTPSLHDALPIFTLTQPDSISLICSSDPEDGKLDCYGDTDGVVKVVASGGTPGYTYKWVNKNVPGTTIGSGVSVTGLGAGTYKVVVTDANGCKDSCEVTLTQPDSISLICSSDPEDGKLDCYGDTDGVVQVSATGGTPGYTYKWVNKNERERTRLSAIHVTGSDA